MKSLGYFADIYIAIYKTGKCVKVILKNLKKCVMLYKY